MPYNKYKMSFTRFREHFYRLSIDVKRFLLGYNLQLWLLLCESNMCDVAFESVFHNVYCWKRR